ncbi:PEGA domain-containing protein [Candidatus Parcubacteria bacterium]|nr:MAG: PEGA domain-containing protein [Candidatus Parcubacteria bacterium]
MNLRYRRILALLFFVVFFLIAPLTLAYARGYRLDFSPFRITKTGVIFISGEPKNVKIFLDGKKTSASALPARLRNVLPGKIQIRIEAPGYQDWLMETEVQDSESVILNNLRLLKSDIFSVVRSAIPPTAEFSPAGDKLAWLNQNSINIASPKEIFTSPKVDNLEKIAWSDDGTSVLGFQKDQSPSVLFTTNGVVKFLPKFPSFSKFLQNLDQTILIKTKTGYATFQNNAWQNLAVGDLLDIKLINANTLLGLQKNANGDFRLLWLDLNAKIQRSKTLPALQTPILNFKNHVFWVTDSSTGKSLWFKSGFLDEQIVELPFSFSDLQAVPKTDSWLIANANSAYLIDPGGNYSILSRWANPVIAPVHLGNQTLLLIRQNELITRNLEYNQVYSPKIEGITKAIFANQVGQVNLLVKDGNLLKWLKAEFF